MRAIFDVLHVDLPKTAFFGLTWCMFTRRFCSNVDFSTEFCLQIDVSKNLPPTVSRRISFLFKRRRFNIFVVWCLYWPRLDMSITAVFQAIDYRSLNIFPVPIAWETNNFGFQLALFKKQKSSSGRLRLLRHVSPQLKKHVLTSFFFHVDVWTKSKFEKTLRHVSWPLLEIAPGEKCGKRVQICGYPHIIICGSSFRPDFEHFQGI
jgi:hypothetical protein